MVLIFCCCCLVCVIEIATRNQFMTAVIGIWTNKTKHTKDDIRTEFIWIFLWKSARYIQCHLPWSWYCIPIRQAMFCFYVFDTKHLLSLGTQQGIFWWWNQFMTAVIGIWTNKTKHTKDDIRTEFIWIFLWKSARYIQCHLPWSWYCIPIRQAMFCFYVFDTKHLLSLGTQQGIFWWFMT